ncbi:Hypothetical predicted protein [Olea europaea subsp. europaea]|uniref:Uncharacterized protein n=1 Tax=Olea europaea subsp. europaea TaxID=158383 RepID=A0A8S0VKE8_OLEEU|nr:Hypothetical predicted protein [Olea europaea subsp. europaea]
MDSYGSDGGGIGIDFGSGIWSSNGGGRLLVVGQFYFFYFFGDCFVGVLVADCGFARSGGGNCDSAGDCGGRGSGYGWDEMGLDAFD